MKENLKKPAKALFIVPYPYGYAPSQRFRFEQYLPYLNNIHSCTYSSFLDENTWKIIYKKGNLFLKVFGILKGFLRRKLLMLKVWQYDFVFIHREAAPIGPPVFEWIIAKVFRKKIIYDFDDAIWLPNTSEMNRLASGIKWHQKVKRICEWSYQISAGNSYLADFARKYNQNVVVNPTTIDTDRLHNPDLFPSVSKPQLPVIGWTGSHSTLYYLEKLVPVIQNLEKDYSFQFMVICNRRPAFNLKSLVYVPWNKETEIEDLLKFDIGVMPLEDDQWAKGKCGFKSLQYMALGIPSLVSPVGVNTEIVEHGKEGFLCEDQDEWQKALELLLNDPELRKEMGKKGRGKVIEKYSVKSNLENFMKLFTVNSKQ